jgi:hypothetical protein
MAAPRQVPFMQRKRQGVAGDAVQARVAGPKRRDLLEGCGSLEGECGSFLQSAGGDDFVQAAPLGITVLVPDEPFDGKI